MIGALIGAGASLLGGVLGSRGAKKAGRLQHQAAMAGVDEQRRQFDTTRQDLMPWLNVGQEALGGQGDLLGLNGGGVQASAIEALRNSPLFQMIYGEGEEAILQNASATGGIRGGNTQRSLADFGGDTLARTIMMQLGQLGGLSGMGQQTGGALGNFGAQSAGNIGNLLGQAGAARAGGALGSTAAWNAALNGAFRSLGPALGKW